MAQKKGGLRVGGYIIRPLGMLLILILVLALLVVGTLFIVRLVGSTPEGDNAGERTVISIVTSTPAALNVDIATPTPTATPIPTPSPTPAPTARTATIRSLGEIAIQKNLLDSARKAAENSENAAASYDFVPMFESIRDVVGNADFTVGDIEGPMDNRPESPFSGSDPMNTPPQIMLSLRNAGVDMLTLANDHALDMLFDGLQRTIENCDQAGMEYVGAAKSQAEKDQPKIVEINGINVAFLNYTSTLNSKEKSASSNAVAYGVNLVDKANVNDDVKKAREAGADIVVAYASWGKMLDRSPSSEQQQMAKAMVSAGVDVIIGFNPHTVQPAYWLEGKRADGTPQKTLCLVATGNFLSDVRKQYFDSGLIFEFTIQETAVGSGQFEVVDPVFIPTWVWRYQEEGQSGYEYRVLAVGEWLEERPEGMSDTDHARLKAVWSEVQQMMAKGNANARVSAN